MKGSPSYRQWTVGLYFAFLHGPQTFPLCPLVVPAGMRSDEIPVRLGRIFHIPRFQSEGIGLTRTRCCKILVVMEPRAND